MREGEEGAAALAKVLTEMYPWNRCSSTMRTHLLDEVVDLTAPVREAIDGVHGRGPGVGLIRVAVPEQIYRKHAVATGSKLWSVLQEGGGTGGRRRRASVEGR